MGETEDGLRSLSVSFSPVSSFATSRSVGVGAGVVLFAAFGVSNGLPSVSLSHGGSSGCVGFPGDLCWWRS